METRQLADIATTVTGTSPRKGDSDITVPFIQIKDLDPSKRALVVGERPSTKRATPAKPGDVLLAARGGQAVVAGTGLGAGLEGGYPTLDVYLIQPDIRRVNPAYLAAWLTFEPVRLQLRASTTGALIPRIPIGSLKRLHVPLPPLQRQRIIGELFHKSHREAELMEQLAASIRTLRERQLAAAFAPMGALKA
jgi:restriction endonuclease S subunit